MPKIRNQPMSIRGHVAEQSLQVLSKAVIRQNLKLAAFSIHLKNYIEIQKGTRKKVLSQ